MDSSEIRKRFLEFFEKRGHAIVPSASLVPEGDSSTLFISAGMQPLVPYLLGQPYPEGKRIVNVQKSLRTGDIDSVGDNTHLTFFEMLGNWSFGDYFKEDAIKWSYELLTSKEEGFGLDPKRLYITIFEGDDNAPLDEESKKIWMDVGVPESKIYLRGANDNWWSPGDNGPSGPDTEMFYDITKEGLGDLTPGEFEQADKNEQVVEVWNDVFMEYEKKDGKVVGKLSQKNVDTGAGLERIATVLQKKDNIFDTDLFTELVAKTSVLSGTIPGARIIADHIRSAIFMITDGVLPANTDRGYVLRRLIRRSVMQTKEKKISESEVSEIVDIVVKKFGGFYKELELSRPEVLKVLNDEIQRFAKTITKGLREFEKLSGDVSGRQAFDLYQSYGFPVEMTRDFAKEKGYSVDTEVFWKEFKQHQKKSRTASVGKFKGGLADHSDEVIKLHTAHHLLLAALQQVLGTDIKQRGSNITPERLRIDFSFDRKLTDEEKQKVEDQINKWIKQDLDVVRKEMSKEEAEKIGAEMEFGQKYPDTVSVFIIGEKADGIISKEFCGGPHVEHTGEIGGLKIKSEKASSLGVRRIKAVLK